MTTNMPHNVTAEFEHETYAMLCELVSELAETVHEISRSAYRQNLIIDDNTNGEQMNSAVELLSIVWEALHKYGFDGDKMAIIRIRDNFNTCNGTLSDTVRCVHDLLPIDDLHYSDLYDIAISRYGNCPNQLNGTV